jgi:hypothetical protein
MRNKFTLAFLLAVSYSMVANASLDEQKAPARATTAKKYLLSVAEARAVKDDFDHDDGDGWGHNDDFDTSFDRFVCYAGLEDIKASLAVSRKPADADKAKEWEERELAKANTCFMYFRIQSGGERVAVGFDGKGDFQLVSAQPKDPAYRETCIVKGITHKSQVIDPNLKHPALTNAFREILNSCIEKAEQTVVDQIKKK